MLNNHFDFKTLSCLFITLAVICALKNIKFFTIVARRLIRFTGNLRTVIYLVLFAFTILVVFRVIPYWIGLAVVLVVLLFIDREALKAVDYPLLLTFVMFFIFAGNMSRIEAVNSLLLFALMNTIFLGVLTVATFFLFK